MTACFVGDENKGCVPELTLQDGREKNLRAGDFPYHQRGAAEEVARLARFAAQLMTFHKKWSDRFRLAPHLLQV